LLAPILGMKKIIIIAIAIFLFSSSPHALAAGNSQMLARELYNYCNNVPTKAEANVSFEGFDGLCIGYFRGYGDGIVNTSPLDHPELMYGFAANNTIGQGIKIFLKYIKEHPEIENSSAEIALLKALLEVKFLIAVPNPMFKNTSRGSYTNF